MILKNVNKYSAESNKTKIDINGIYDFNAKCKMQRMQFLKNFCLTEIEKFRIKLIINSEFIKFK